MASAEDIKLALVADQAAARDAYELAVSAISTVSALASWAIGALTLIVAVVGIFGWMAIRRKSRKTAVKVATAAIQSYLISEAFAKELEARVAQEVSQQRRSVKVTADTNGDDEDPFPSPPK